MSNTVNTGDPASVQHINNVIKHFASATPPGAPVEDECYIDKSGSPRLLKQWNGSSWETVSLVAPSAQTYFPGNDVIDQNNDCFEIIKTPSTITNAKLTLVGKNFPSFFYTELGQHNHAAGGLADTFASDSHTHSFSDSGSTGNEDLGSHNHGDNFSTATESSHEHEYTYYGAGSAQSTYNGDTHNHTVNGNVSYEDLGSHNHSFSVSGTTGTPSATASVSGNTANAGVNGGTVSSSQKTTFTASFLEIFFSTDPATSWGTKIAADLTALYDDENGAVEVDISSDLSGMADSIVYVKFTLNTGTEVGGKLVWLFNLN